MHAAISIGFEQQQYAFTEPPHLKLFDVLVIKEDGRRSEQTFEVIFNVSNDMTSPYLPASPDKDYEHPPVRRVVFPPDQESIAWSFGLVPNEELEEIEAFRVAIAPNSTGYPTFNTSGGSLTVFNEALIVIKDAQSKNKTSC